MTLEQQKSLEMELNDAVTDADVAKAHSHILLALIDCQRKTADRVKRLSWKFLVLALGLGGGGGAAITHMEKIRAIFGL